MAELCTKRTTLAKTVHTTALTRTLNKVFLTQINSRLHLCGLEKFLVCICFTCKIISAFFLLSRFHFLFPLSAVIQYFQPVFTFVCYIVISKQFSLLSNLNPIKLLWFQGTGEHGPNVPVFNFYRVKNLQC